MTMARDIMLSNGDLTVGLDSYGQVATLRYPDHSSNNHVGSGTLHHKIGVYSENAVHWLDDGAWKVKQAYYPGRLISRTIANNLWLDIRLEIQDYVDSELDILVRNIHVVNLSGRERHAKLFLHQSFVIDDNLHDVDTAQYLPTGIVNGLSVPAITHYHGDKAFVISGQCCDCPDGFIEFSIGHFGKYDGNYMSGVWCDAADGTLSGNTHEQGHTDSIIGFDITLQPHDSMYVNYYLSATNSTTSSARNLQKFLHEGIDARTKKTAAHWLEWLQPAMAQIKDAVAPEHRYQIVDSLVSLRGNMGNNGAVVDSRPGDMAKRNYAPLVHPTTAAIAATTLAQLGLDIDAARIYDFFVPIIARDNYLLPTYTTTGAVGPNSYSYEQLDDTTILPINIADSAHMLLSLCRTLDVVTTTRTIPAEWRKRWTKLGAPLANFLADYIDPISKLPIASYHGGNSSPELLASDTRLVYAALMAAAHVSERVKDTDGVIKYQTVAEDIRENASELWVNNAEADSSSDGPDTDSENANAVDELDKDGSKLLQQLIQINRLLRQSKDSI